MLFQLLLTTLQQAILLATVRAGSIIIFVLMLCLDGSRMKSHSSFFNEENSETN